MNVMFSKRKVYTAVFLLVFAICLFGFVWSWIATKDIRSNSVSDEVKSRKVVVENLILTETKDEQIYWELYAKKGSYSGSSGLVVLEGALGNFYNEEKEVTLSIEADKGTYGEENKAITLEGNVFVVAKDGSSIKADKIVWKGRDEDIIATGNIIVKRNDDFYSTSDKAIFNHDLTKFKIEGNCKSSVYDPGEIEGQGKKSSFNLGLGAKK